MSVSTLPKNYLRRTFIAAQENQIEILNKLYDKYPSGKEVANISVYKVAEEIGTTYSILNRLIDILEEQDVITRRVEWIKGGKSAGKRAYWTLRVTRQEALARLVLAHKAQRRAVNHPPVPKSLRNKIIAAFDNKDSYKTVADLAAAIGEPSTDFHNITHVMHSLKRAHIIDFKISSTKDQVPYDIRITKKASNGGIVIRQASLEELMPTSTVEEKPKESEPIKAPEPIVVDTLSDTQRFPITMRLINRKGWLEQAAKLAEMAAEEDITIMLQERLGKPFSATESEMIALYEALKACRGE